MEDEFVKDLNLAFGQDIMEDSFAAEVWSALASVTWHNPSRNLLGYAYSFRSAGALIAEMRGEGHYMDWYCSGPYAIVSDYIAMSMKKLGWIADVLPDVCDEPKCIKDAGCGWLDNDIYRRTCYEHSSFNKGER